MSFLCITKICRDAAGRPVAPNAENNNPKYVLIEYSEFENVKIADDEDILSISRRIMDQNKEAYEELAK